MKVRARSVPDKFRRAGLAFTKNPAEYDVDKKTLEILKAEPMLFVEVLPEEKSEEAPGAGKEEKGKEKDKEKGKGK